ncbi:hypothetical protein [Microbacter margulisiae]|uniref:MetA-pathway of phenol degradation n=1 Tax=Microbacter margulisiae TaxID=1350067 RepID=A0A7W5DPY1_9PORP|nr:hypothetical protein [Microbacter margulisiae]MBB3186811.1 hypothetical protein [Microbacter margulisiae]
MTSITTSTCVSAQDKKDNFNLSVDLVSSYVWRGIAQEGSKGGTPNIQPTLTYTIGSFSLGASGSYAFSGDVKEIDLNATLALPHAFSLTLTDDNWNNSNNNAEVSSGYANYFNLRSNGTGHILEGTLAYGGCKTFPVSFSWNTMFYGADKNLNGKNAYSTYVELDYPVASNVNTFLGASLFDSPAIYGNKGFSVINVGIKVTRKIKLSNTFSVPVYGILGANPQAEKAFFVAGVTL